MKKFLIYLFAICFVIPCAFIFVACEDKDIDNKEPVLYNVVISEQIENGIISANKQTSIQGESVIITVQASDGYMLEQNSLKYNNVIIENNQFLMPDEDVIITANFVLKQFNINYNNCSFAENPNPNSILYTEEINLLPATKSGYAFEGWFTDYEFTNEIQKIEVGTTKDLTIYAKFEAIFVALIRTNSSLTKNEIRGLTGYGKTLENIIVPTYINGIPTDYIVKLNSNNLVNLEISEGIRGAENNAFDNNVKLKTVKLPKTFNIVNFGSAGLFTDCPKLEEILVDDENSEYYSIDGVLFENDISYLGNQQLLVCYPAGKNDESYKIPEEIIKAYFHTGASFKTLIIPKSLTSIVDLHLCKNIENIQIDEENENFSYQNGALYNNGTLLRYFSLDKSITYFNSGLYDISDYAFYNCDNLDYVIMRVSYGQNAPSLATAFYGCKQDIKIYIRNTYPTSWSEQDRFYDYVRDERVYFYSETEPTQNGRFWHFDSDGVMPIIWGK